MSVTQEHEFDLVSGSAGKNQTVHVYDQLKMHSGKQHTVLNRNRVFWRQVHSIILCSVSMSSDMCQKFDFSVVTD